MKLGPLDLPALPALALPRLPLAAFSRRLVFHGVFVLLALATLALAITLLTEEKQRSRQHYEAGFAQNLAGIAAQLRHPTGQLALLNADLPTGSLSPRVLPFSAIDFDDPFKARQAVEMSGCAMRWPSGDQLCAAVGQSAYAGGFIYLVASVALPPAVPRERGGLDLQVISRARISLQLPGSLEVWTAPFEAASDAPVQRVGGGQRGRLTGFATAQDQLPGRARPDRDFRAWLWQEAPCAHANISEPDCARPTLLSIRLPVQAWREALFQSPAPAWPPNDLAQVKLRLQWLAPGGAVLFDSQSHGVTPPLALADLAKGLAPGEKLSITRQGAVPSVIAQLQGQEPQAEPAAPWLTRLILRLPADTSAVRLAASDEVATPNARYRLQLTGDLQSVDRSLGATATRLSWFVGAMLAAIALAWLIIDVGLVRRVAVLTQRAAALQYNMQDPQVERRLGDLEVADLRGPDELGILAGSLAALLQRVKDGARREHIRAEQELDRWHAVGHEIMSPLQSLMVLHGTSDDPSHRYVQRMQQAVRVLYGTASPSEAIESATLAVGTLDLNAFLQHVAGNAPFAGIANVHYSVQPQPVMVRADEYSLEDAVTHVLRNADRHRLPGSPITLTLAGDARMAELRIHNQGPGIDEMMLERVFDYGVSDQDPNTTGERRGQGLFVARTYMAKMDGTISALNLDDGVAFVLRLVRTA